MASRQGVVEHYMYYRVCECAWRQPCATANPGFHPYPTRVVNLQRLIFFFGLF
jgi:hypothetical protein